MTLYGMQARNQFGTPGGAKSFLRRALIFLTTSNRFKVCMSNTFFQGVRKILQGVSPPLRHLWLRALWYVQAVNCSKADFSSILMTS